MRVATISGTDSHAESDSSVLRRRLLGNPLCCVHASRRVDLVLQCLFGSWLSVIDPDKLKLQKHVSAACTFADNHTIIEILHSLVTTRKQV